MDKGTSESGCVSGAVEAVEAVEGVELVFVLVVGEEEEDEERLSDDMAACVAVLQRGHVKICCTTETMDSLLLLALKREKDRNMVKREMIRREDNEREGEEEDGVQLISEGGAVAVEHLGTSKVPEQLQMVLAIIASDTATLGPVCTLNKYLDRYHELVRTCSGSDGINAEWYLIHQ